MSDPNTRLSPIPPGDATKADMPARPESFRTDAKIDALRVPPQSVEAEQAVIGGLMLAPESLDRVGDFLTEHDFYRRDHRLIYRAIRELSEKSKPFDAVTLGEWFEANGLSEQIGGTGYLVELASSTPSAANIRAYAEIVREKAVLRQLIEAGTETAEAVLNPRTGATILDLPEASKSQIDAAIGAAEKAFTTWSRTPRASPPW